MVLYLTEKKTIKKKAPQDRTRLFFEKRPRPTRPHKTFFEGLSCARVLVAHAVQLGLVILVAQRPRATCKRLRGSVSAPHKTAQRHAQDPHKTFPENFPHNMRARLFHKTSAQGFPTTYRTRPDKSWWHKALRCATNAFFFS